MHESVVRIYSDKLARIQVIINCLQHSVAQMCTHEDTLAHYFGAPSIDDVMTQYAHNRMFPFLKLF